MSAAQDTPSTTGPPNSPNGTQAAELGHITQEMYKKNFELADRNKTLALLRRIDEIILSSVTDTQQIAQQVADIVVVEAELKAVIILLHDKEGKLLNTLAISQMDGVRQTVEALHKPFYTPKISIREDTNLIIQSFTEKRKLITHSLSMIFQPYYTTEELETMQKITGIHTSLIYPLVVRGESIGAMIICSAELQDQLTEYQKDLFDRLADVIGIAIDNALLYQKLQDANETLKQLDELKDEFVSLASHELRTPMTVVKSYLWMLLAKKGGEITDKQKFYLDRAYQSTDRLIKFVNDMLNVSRIEANRISIQPKPIQIVTLADDIVSEIEPRTHELGLNMAVNKNEDIPLVFADPDKIREVIMNLLGNSMKFTPHGGTITISFERKLNFVDVKITDTGVGIEKEDQEKLFQKFGMVGKNYLVRMNSQGTGLGLYITKSIIELHGGEVSVFSEGKGKGTTFTFSLPVYDASKQSPKQIQNP